jgi:hypothetical protein
MRSQTNLFAVLGILLFFSQLFSQKVFAATETYREDFNAVSELPENIMVLAGDFHVKEDAGQKLLELAAEPLETYTALFGPAHKENIAVRGMAKSTGKGRRFPVFGFGVGGVTGVVLRVAGAKKALEFVRNEEQLASVNFPFPSDKWVSFHVQVRKTGDAAWIAEGKAWVEGSEEPAAFMLNVPLDKAPVTGRASCWGVPYSGEPILFDNFSVLALSPINP